MASFLSRVARVTVVTGVSLLLAVPMSGCELSKNNFTYDRAGEKDRQDYRDALAPAAPVQQDAANVPDFQPVLATPDELALPSPLVTVSVNQTVGLRDLLFEIADQANVDLEMDPQIHGSIIFTAKDRPFDQVIDRICEIAGLRYKFKDNVLRVELDRPFVKTYSVDYINATRKSESSIKTEISLSTAAGDTGGSSSGGGGSKSGVDTTIDGDLWKELGDNIEQILTSSDTAVTLATTTDPVATPQGLNPQVSMDPNNPTPPALPGSAGVQPMPAAAAPTLNINAAPSEPVVPNAPATYSISKQTGILTVFANQRQQRMVEKFLNEFRKRAGTQILIEAKVLQVDLKDEFATGIDWSNLERLGLPNLTLTSPIPALDPASTAGFSGILSSSGDTNLAIAALGRFGTVRALSSPRVTVLNNQPAIVNVAQNNVYFDFDVTVEPAQAVGERPTVGIQSDQKSVPEGVLLTVLPTANPDTGEIQLVVRPTISKITSYVTDPTIPLTIATSGVTIPGTLPVNRIPQVALQEIDSTVKMRTGQTMVMGGLMKDANSVTDTGIPLLSDIPYLGYAFKSHGDKVEKTELIIFLRAVIVPGNNADEMDKKIYNTFSEDRRPGNL